MLSFTNEGGFNFGSTTSPDEPNHEHGYTALIYAVEAGHFDIVRMLLQAGADVNAASADGRTPLMHAFVTGNIDLIRLLLQQGADPKRQSVTGETAESIARKQRLEYLLGFL
jgi:ankyrin repeat protein